MMAGPQKSALSDPYDVGWVLLDESGYTEDEAYAFLTANAAGVFPQSAALVASANPAAHTGAMIALVPSAADLARLALEGGEPIEELHLTLAYLGEADAIDEEMRARIIDAAGGYFTDAVNTEAFAVNVFNPHNPEMKTAVVLGIKGEPLVDNHSNVMSAVQGVFGGMPDNHRPWIPHVTLKYTDDIRRENQDDFLSRLGPVKFDTLRFAFGGENIDVPLYDNDDEDPLTASTKPWRLSDDLDVLMASLSVNDVQDVVVEPERYAAWSGILTVEGVESGDGRMFSFGSLDWDNPPLPLMYQPANIGGHSGSVLVGQIQRIYRKGNQVFGEGIIDLEAQYNGENIGREVHRLMSERFLNGVSVDVDKVKDADVKLIFADGEAKPRMTVFNRGRVRGATMVAFPAFTEAKIYLTGDVLTASAVGEILVASTDGEVLTAAVHTIEIPDLPPAEWFAPPTDVEMRGALTVTDEGRVFGRLAPAGVTHRSVKAQVPMRNVDYSRFMGKETLVAGGGRVVTGPITMNCGHAPTDPQVYGTLDKRMEHYDNACSVIANIRVGEDDKGVWVAGALTPFATAEQVTKLMSCTLSGDWQPHPDRQGVREFIAALAVPVPGFAMARSAASVTMEDGVVVSAAIPVEFAEMAAVNAQKRELGAQMAEYYTVRKFQLAKELRSRDV